MTATRFEWKRPIPNRERLPTPWDAMAFGLVFGMLALVWIVFRQTGQPIATVEQAPQSLDIALLPLYALRTTLRMLAALVASFVFTVVYATVAAKSRRAGMVLIPILDVLQSVPILGFISFTVTFFLWLFPGTVLGPELACIFAIFTGQAWNMTFSLYQSLRTIPSDLAEAAAAFHFTPWQRFIRLDMPFAMPGLIWNTMMSMSGGWFFIVAAESVKVGSVQFSLPGIGTYLAAAIDRRDLGAVGWTILTMTLVILLYDQLMFRPLVAWGDKFRFDTSTGGTIAPHSWLLTRLKRARWMMALADALGRGLRNTLKLRLPASRLRLPRAERGPPAALALDIAWFTAVTGAGVYGVVLVWRHVATELGWPDVGEAFLLGFYTLARVAVLIAVASLIWVPAGVYIGLRPRIAEYVQPVAQFLAAFPANLMFPVAVIGILHFRLNPDLWLSPLIILGTQWYILFNVVAGATAFPSDLRETARSFQIKGWLWWRKVILPGILPYYVTGALTAAGGAWNASIVAEAVSWGDDHVTAHGLGAYIAEMTGKADYPRLILGIAAMSLYVILFNRILWRPLYRWSERRFNLA